MGFGAFGESYILDRDQLGLRHHLLLAGLDFDREGERYMSSWAKKVET